MSDDKGSGDVPAGGDAAEGIRATLAAADAVGPGAGAGDAGRIVRLPKTGQRRDGLPAACPIEPLGMSGEAYYYFDAWKRIRAGRPIDHGKKWILSLMGPYQGLVNELWPRFGPEGKIAGFDADAAAGALMEAAGHAGIFDPTRKARGVGAWSDDDGNLILHCGDALWSAATGWTDPGVLDGRVYEAGEAQPRPAPDPEPADGAGAVLLDLLGRWRWARGATDARLMAGWIGAAMVGGALPWRPAAWITGDRGTGKSTLLDDLVEPLLGGALVHPSDATAAGLWQELKWSTLPVAIDEAEPDDHQAIQRVIRLARLAASGGLVLRGGAEHKATSFVARSSFLFSSILVPPLSSADRSRLAILELERIERGAEPPVLTPGEIRALGARLRRRMVDQWPRYKATFEAYRMQLAVHAGHAARGADQFGALLACGDLLTADAEPDAEALEAWSTELKADRIAETSEDDPGWRRCLNVILAHAADAYRGGERATLGELIAVELWPSEDHAVGLQAARQALGRHGLRVKRDKSGLWWLAVANSHPGLDRVFDSDRGRRWSGGVWSQELRRAVVPTPAGDIQASPAPSPTHFGGLSSRCVMVPIVRDDYRQGGDPALFDWPASAAGEDGPDDGDRAEVVE